MKNFNSKKLLYSIFFLFINYLTHAQSVTIEPTKTTNQSNTGGENINVVANSNSLGIYGRRFNGTFDAKTPILSGNELFRVSAGGWWNANNQSQNSAIKFLATEDWNIVGSGSKITFTTTPNSAVNQIERMVINHDGKIGVGLVSPQSKLHIHEATSNFIQAMQITSDGTGSTATDGLGFKIFSPIDFIFPNAASIMNNENGQLILGANNKNTIRITPEGNVGINSPIGSPARLSIFHDGANNPANPHLNLVTNVDANNGMIKMTNILNSRYFGQYFNLNSSTAANNFISFDYNGNTPILDLKGNGNVEVAGYTKLGGTAAPSIKMITLTNITSGSLSGSSDFPHGLIVSKILAYEVLVDVGGGIFVKENHTTQPGRQFDTEINSLNVRVYNHPSNSGNIFTRPLKVIITYSE